MVMAPVPRRRLIAAAYAALAAMVISASAAAQTTTIDNPGFEGAYSSAGGCANVSGSVADGWTDNTCWDESRPVIRYGRDTGIKHGGVAAQKITLVSGGRVQFAQFFSTPFQSGRRYEAGLWMRSDAPMFVHAELRQAGPPYAVYSSKLVKLTTTWTRYTFGGFADATDAGLLIIATRPGTFWVDDASLTSVAATVPPPSPSGSAIPRGYFGMHFNYLDTRWPAVNGAIGAVRIWDADSNLDGSGTGAQWAEINTAPGVFDWSGLDARLAAARAQRADLVYTLGGRTPQWASARPDETSESPGGGSSYGPGQAAEPKSDQIWQDWVRTVATRYKGKIRFWEIWNEPDIVGFYSGTPDKLLDLTRQAHAILKQVDPNNKVLSPAFADSGGPAYLDYFLANGGGKSCDIISYHFYIDRPEGNGRWRAANLRGVIQRHGAQWKPLWNTEQGWIDLDGTAPPISEETGAAYVARSYVLNWAYRLQRFYYYTWDNEWNRFPFVELDGVTLRPAGRAYREVAAWMIGSVMESLTTDAQGSYVATLRRADGRRARILWNPDSQPVLTIPAGWGATRLRDLSGGVQPLGGSLRLTGSPVLVE